MKLIAVGDVHACSDWPWSEGYRAFFKWFLEDSGLDSPENIFLQVGDFFDASTMTGELAHDAVEFFQRMKCKTKIVLSGNHDYRPRWGNALDVLRRVGVHVVVHPELFEVEGNTLMLLPYLYGSMKDVTEQFAYENRGHADFVFGHFADRDMFGTELDISFLEKGTDGCTVQHILLGHDHSQVGNYIGSIYPTAFSERGRQHRIYSIDLATGEKVSHSLPVFLDYVDADFSDDPKAYQLPHPVILDVYGAPSVREGEAKFSAFRVREVYTNKMSADSVAIDSKAMLDPKVLVQRYVAGVERTGVRTKLAETLKRTGRL